MLTIVRKRKFTGKELATKCMTKGLIYTEISKAAQRLEEVETKLEKTKKELRELGMAMHTRISFFYSLRLLLSILII